MTINRVGTALRAFAQPTGCFCFVIAALDPAIHAATKLAVPFEGSRHPHVSMDHRVKPGGDEKREQVDV